MLPTGGWKGTAPPHTQQYLSRKQRGSHPHQTIRTVNLHRGLPSLSSKWTKSDLYEKQSSGK